MKYKFREIGMSLQFKDLIRVNYLRNLWTDVITFIKLEVKDVDVSKYRDSQYLKLLRMKIAKNLLKFKSKMYLDNVGALKYLHKVVFLASIFAEYIYFYEKKGVYLPRKDLHV